jgi:hypothetical protein
MFGQIIDLLVKHDDERRRISFLFLKLLFTGTIAAYLYCDIFGTYFIISITNFKALADFLIHGKAFICFALFYIIWSITYGLISFVMIYFAIWLSSKLYHFLQLLINNPDKIKVEISDHKQLQKLARFYVHIFNIVDIIEIEKETVMPGKSFYKFYDYLIDIENGKKSVSSREFTDTIALTLQFVIIYNILGLDFLSSSVWLLLAAILISTYLTFASIAATTLSMLVDIKHGRLMNLMEKIEPNYKKKGGNESTENYNQKRTDENNDNK